MKPDRDAEFREVARQLAPRIHERWRPTEKGSPGDVGFDQLPEETRNANLAAAERIPRVLAVAGLRVVPRGTGTTAGTPGHAAAVRQIIDALLEELSEAEHKGWMDEKRRSGWTYGKTLDKVAKRHPSMIPYSELSREEKDKDRDSVLKYQELLRACGFEILPVGANDA